MPNDKKKPGSLGGILRAVPPSALAALATSALVLHHFDYSLQAVIASGDFLVGLAAGGAVYALALEYHRGRIRGIDRAKEEGKFESVLRNTDKISFSRRVGDMVFLNYLEYNLILNLKSEVMYIFHNDQCLVTSNSIQDNPVVRQLRGFIHSRFGGQINDFVTINGVAYSRQMIEFYTNYLQSSTSGLREYLDKLRGGAEAAAQSVADEQELSVDHILDKISKHGISSLSREEMDFLKSQR